MLLDKYEDCIVRENRKHALCLETCTNAIRRWRRRAIAQATKHALLRNASRMNQTRGMILERATQNEDCALCARANDVDPIKEMHATRRRRADVI